MDTGDFFKIDNDRLLAFLGAWVLMHYFGSDSGSNDPETGVEITSVGSSAWRFIAFLSQTELENAWFEGDHVSYGDGRTLCWVADHEFRAQCPPTSLGYALAVFAAWAQRVRRFGPDHLRETSVLPEFRVDVEDGWPEASTGAASTAERDRDLEAASGLTWLQGWYQFVGAGPCDRERVSITMYNNPGWCLAIDLAGTSLSGHIFAVELEERDEENWIAGSTDDDLVNIACGMPNLGEAIGRFRDWAKSIDPES